MIASYVMVAKVNLMKRYVHSIAGGVAIVVVATFWLSTLVSELSGIKPLIVQVKTAIPWGFLLLIPALIATGGTGFALSGGRKVGLIAKKRNRMPLIAGNGILILIPIALYLAAKAKAGEFDTTFYIIQTVELIAGAINLWLLSKNALDGRKITIKYRKAAKRAGKQG